MDHLFIILTGILVITSCTLTGSFLVLRKSSMLADAISHAVLPGIVLAYLFSGAQPGTFALAGAAIAGMFASLVIGFLSRKTTARPDAVIGIVYAVFFAIGIILTTIFSSHVDLDQECVLYGDIAFVPLDRWILDNGIDMGPKQIYPLLILCLVTILLFFMFIKPLTLVTFDPSYAGVLGISSVLWSGFLNVYASIVSVFCFNTVGAVLVVAFMCVPAAIALLFGTTFRNTVLLALIFGWLAVPLGYYIAVFFDGSIAGSLSMVLGLLLIPALILKKITKNSKPKIFNV